MKFTLKLQSNVNRTWTHNRTENCMATWCDWQPCVKDSYLMAELIISCRVWLTFSYRAVHLTFHSRSSLVPQRKPLRRRYESPGMYSDDDANSDASSACSERSYGSRNGGIPHYLRQTEDVAEILNHCASSNWSERKEGLLGLQNLLKSQRILRWDRTQTVPEWKCELWCSMFSLLKALCELLNSKRRCYYIIALSGRTYNKSL